MSWRVAIVLAASLLGSVASAEAAPPPRAYALLVSGDVVAIDTPSGAVVARQSIGPRAELTIATPMLVRRGGLVHALTPRRGTQELVTLDAADLRVVSRVALGPQVRFSALAVGASSGRLHALGTLDGAPVLQTVDGGQLGPLRTLRAAAGRDWMPIGAAVSADEQRLLVSYHGQPTTGADVIGLPEGTPCSGRASIGCLSAIHGDAVFAGDRVVGATGSTELVVYDADGREHRRIDTRLPRNHLMYLARDTGGAIVAAAACAQVNAISVVDRGRARVRRGICGEMVAARGGLAAIGASNPTGRRRIRTGVHLMKIRGMGRPRFVRTASPVSLAI